MQSVLPGMNNSESSTCTELTPNHKINMGVPDGGERSSIFNIS